MRVCMYTHTRIDTHMIIYINIILPRWIISIYLLCKCAQRNVWKHLNAKHWSMT